MEAFSSRLSDRIKNIELSVGKTDEIIKQLGSNIEKYVDKAKETLKKKHVINPKPQKRIMRIISENDEESDTEAPKINNNEPLEVLKEKSPQRESLRPIRTAKVNANKNLKEVPSNTKLRNDNGNVAVKIKTERISSVTNNKRDSAKENTSPDEEIQRVSVDEGVQMGSESDLASEKNKRSMSVEIISSKPEEIEITDENDADKMPPPPIPGKKKKVNKQSSQEIPTDPTQQIPVRFTRSKIKKEKSSIGKTVSSKELTSKNLAEEQISIQRSASESVLQQNVNETTNSLKKGAKKKYPLPILIKLERTSADQEAPQTTSKDQLSNSDIENVPPKESTEKEPSLPNINNETVTINTNLPVNQTVTLANNINPNETYNKNAHDSLMTEDNDEDCSMEVPLVHLKEKNHNAIERPALPLKLKKNEVFNPYLCSPVKQKVQAFEKHAVATPDKVKATTSKYSTLKSGTPSKIAIYGSKTTPLNNAKQKYIAAITGSASSSTSSLSSNKKPSKKLTSLTLDSNEDLRKNQAQAIILEEKKRQREEKQRQVQLQREAIEKQKREQTLQQQRERDEKFRKIMQEKEEAKRMEALKKKMHKENQEKKYAEEKARKDEFTLPKEPQSASKDDSLYIKMQKQIILEKTLSQNKKHDKNTYSFEMLHTDDSTDDESQPSKKRPEPPQWSKKQVRQKQIYIQSFANANLLDTLFSAHPINVNLKEIFPTIDARKLIRNSSAVWNTPPRYSQIPKY